MQFQLHVRQLLAGYMKQRSVGEYTIEIVIRKIELEKILLPHFAAAVGARHVGEMCGAFQADRDVTEFGNHFEVSPGPAAKIKYCETRLTLDVLQHRRDVLADIVIARACPELFGALVIMFQCKGDYFFQVLRTQFLYSFPPQRLCDRLASGKLKSSTSPSLQIANEGSREHHRVTVRFNKNAMRSGEYWVSPLVKAWRHQQVRNTQVMRLRDTKGQA